MSSFLVAPETEERCGGGAAEATGSTSATRVGAVEQDVCQPHPLGGGRQLGQGELVRVKEREADRKALTCEAITWMTKNHQWNTRYVPDKAKMTTFYHYNKKKSGIKIVNIKFGYKLATSNCFPRILYTM